MQRPHSPRKEEKSTPISTTLSSSSASTTPSIARRRTAPTMKAPKSLSPPQSNTITTPPLLRSSGSKHQHYKNQQRQKQHQHQHQRKTVTIQQSPPPPPPMPASIDLCLYGSRREFRFRDSDFEYSQQQQQQQQQQQHHTSAGVALSTISTASLLDDVHSSSDNEETANVATTSTMTTTKTTTTSADVDTGENQQKIQSDSIVDSWLEPENEEGKHNVDDGVAASTGADDDDAEKDKQGTNDNNTAAVADDSGDNTATVSSHGKTDGSKTPSKKNDEAPIIGTNQEESSLSFLAEGAKEKQQNEQKQEPFAQNEKITDEKDKMKENVKPLSSDVDGGDNTMTKTKSNDGKRSKGRNKIGGRAVIGDDKIQQSNSFEFELDEIRKSKSIATSSDEEEEDDDEDDDDANNSSSSQKSLTEQEKIITTATDVSSNKNKSVEEEEKTTNTNETDNPDHGNKGTAETPMTTAITLTPPTSPQPSTAPARPVKAVGPDDSMIYDVNDIRSLSSAQKIEMHSRRVMREKVRDAMAELEESVGDGLGLGGLENRWAMRERLGSMDASSTLNDGSGAKSLASIEEDESSNRSNTGAVEPPYHVIDIQDLRRLASQGITDVGSHRAVAWRVLLGYLPPDTSQWEDVLKRDRTLYRNLVSELFVQPSHHGKDGRRIVENEGKSLRGRGIEKDGVSVRDLSSLVKDDGEDGIEDENNGNGSFGQILLVRNSTTGGRDDGLGVEVEHVIRENEETLNQESRTENEEVDAGNGTDGIPREKPKSTVSGSSSNADADAEEATLNEAGGSASFQGDFGFREEDVEEAIRMRAENPANHRQSLTRTASEWAKEKECQQTDDEIEEQGRQDEKMDNQKTDADGSVSSQGEGSLLGSNISAVDVNASPSGGRQLPRRASEKAREIYIKAKGELPVTPGLEIAGNRASHSGLAGESIVIADGDLLNKEEGPVVIAMRRDLTSKIRKTELIGKDAPVPVHRPELLDGFAELVPARVREQWKKSGRESTALAGFSTANGGTSHINALLVVDDKGFTPDGSRKERISVNDDPLSLEVDSKWAQFFENATLLDEIRKDVVRTHPDLHFFLEPENNLGQRRYAALERILFVWAKLNKGVRYVQGMNEIVGTIYFVLANDFNEEWACEAEADAYFLFNSLMVEMRDVFVPDLDDADTGIQGRISNMMALLSLHDPEVRCHLDDCGIDPSFYAIRWLTTLLSREFLLPDTIRLWDSMFASTHKDNFLRYVCVTMLMIIRDDLLKGDFSTCLRLLQSYPPTNIDRLLESSRALWIYESQITLACHKGGISLQQALTTIAPPPALIMAYGLRGGVAPYRGERMRQAGEKSLAVAKEASSSVASAGKSFFGNARGLWGEWRSNSEKKKQFRRAKTT